MDYPEAIHILNGAFNLTFSTPFFATELDDYIGGT